jgi:hypothetical protein
MIAQRCITIAEPEARRGQKQKVADLLAFGVGVLPNP